MLQFLLDTDHLTLLEHKHPVVMRHIAQQGQGVVGFAAVTVEESLRSRLTAIAQARDGASRIDRYALLLETLRRFQHYAIAPFDQTAENHYQQIRALRLRVGARDQKIAAIALANTVILVTRNRSDFGQIPGLVLEDWSK